MFMFTLRGWRHVRTHPLERSSNGYFPNQQVLRPRRSQIFLCRFVNTSYSRCFQHHRLPREGFSVGFSIFDQAYWAQRDLFHRNYIRNWSNPFKCCSSVSGLMTSFGMSEVTLLSGNPDTSWVKPPRLEEEMADTELTLVLWSQIWHE